ncbi:MarR family transcriptional regulator [Flavobacterium noncentrifugens]|uniref:Transcriptional regulator, HxlR family n=1 Tax=Flavobacterium noncentrifugens TaxID=1128970 RepID=A0A1G8ZF15_9FLAO|nr:helix-turn-helix domain-containing protein [Flavobacterium noncentrifugens]GEP51968.1 MarR family transcriptional regulator [Flavobacterium noncentrifugens]SDK13553.1 transcriptional regulator, HxlR family [Flavobacterium noncentrifugens]
MYERKTRVNVECGLHLFMEVMNGKWKISLVWSIYNGIFRPSELQRKIPNASRRVLETQLNQLVNHGILTKKIYNVKPPKVEYGLTKLGKSLIPIIKSTAKWGEENREELEKAIA